MKCPKCGYIGFESTERCRNCGYDFSLAAPLDAPPDMPLASQEPFGPLADLTLKPENRRASARPPRAPLELDLDRLIAEAAAPPDLPLFDERPARPRGKEAPLIDTQPARPPLAVRRPVPPRPRAIPPRPEPLELGLEAAEPAPTRAVAADVPRRRVVEMAGGGRRLSAGLLDVSILAGLDLVVLYFTLRLCDLGSGEIGLLPLVPVTAFFALLNGGYFVAFTAAGGQTIGKMATGTMVISENGEDVVFGQAVVRALAYLASLLPAGLGFVPAFLGQGRALHDRVANTRVVRVRSS
jgi:uncharacterized RDD family membrane protein YckC